MSGGLSDGSWTLTVFVTDLQVERSLRVRGDLHIGGVMIRLVDELGKKKIFYYHLMSGQKKSGQIWEGFQKRKKKG